MCIATKACRTVSLYSPYLAHTTYYAHGVVQGKAANREDGADGDDNVAEEEDLHFPVTSQSRSRVDCCLRAHLRPTAAFFLSDRQSRNRVVKIAIPHSIMEPATVSRAPVAQDLHVWLAHPGYAAFYHHQRRSLGVGSRPTTLPRSLRVLGRRAAVMVVSGARARTMGGQARGQGPAQNVHSILRQLALGKQSEW